MKKTYQKTKIYEILCLISGVVLSIIGLYLFHKQYLCDEYTVLQFILAAVVCLGGALLSLPLSKKSRKKKTTLYAVITALVFAVVLVGLMLLINSIIGNGELNSVALFIPVYLSFIMTAVLVLLCIIKIFDKKLLKMFFSLAVLIGFAVGSYSYIVPFAVDEIYDGYKAPAPILSTYTKTEDDDNMINGDFYVSTKGNDTNSGTKEAPFLTIEKAVEAVRNTDKSGKSGITVCIEGGEYRVSFLSFTKEDSGTADCPITYRSYNGEVVLNGRVTSSPNDFAPVSEYPDISERLSP